MPEPQGPWTKYQSPGSGDAAPWTRYQAGPSPSASATPDNSSLFGRLTNEAARDVTFGLSDQAAALGSAAGAVLPGSAHPGGFWQTYENRLNQLRQEHAELESSWPGWAATKAGQILGGMVFLGPEALPLKKSLGAAMGEGAAVGAGVGAASGLGGSDLTKHPVTDTALGAAGGAAFGAAVPAVTRLARPALSGLKAHLPSRFPEEAGKRAVARIAERQKQDELAGGPTAAELRGTISAIPGKPQALLDVGGENVRALAGHVGRTPGASRNIVSTLFARRDPKAPERLIDDIREHISAGGSAYDAREALLQKARADSDPLYKEAFKPGSVAPLEHQFTQAFQDASAERAAAAEEVRAAQRRLTLAVAKKARAGDNVYLSSAALREEREAQDALQAAQRNLAENTDTLEDIRGAMREAQGAAARGERGGVWSPQIGRLLKNPRIQEGLREGLAIQRDEADAAGIPFNPHDYAITGLDAEGNPIVSKVPNMRALHAAKKGLDRMIDEYRDKMTGILHLNERGRAIDSLRRSLLAEMGRLDPTYAEANAAFSEPMQLRDMIKRGQNFRSTRPEQIRDILAQPRADRDAFRLGVADRLIMDVKGTAKNADEAKKMLNNLLGEEQLREVMKDDPGFETFLKKIAAEKRMFESRTPTIGGAQTAGRMAEDAGSGGLVAPALRVGGGIAVAAHGEPFYGLHYAARGLRQLGDLLSRPGAAEREEIARRLAVPERALPTLAEIEAYSSPLSRASKRLSVLGGLGAGATAPYLTGEAQ